MKLSEQQERMVSAFLRQVAEFYDDLPAADRVQAVSDIKARLHRDLGTLGDGAPRDEDLSMLLRKWRATIGTEVPRTARSEPMKPEMPAPEAPRAKVPGPRPSKVAPSTGLGSDERRWLGVCVTLASRFGIEVALVRTAFVLFGLVTGPIAIIVYLGIYFETYFFAQDSTVPAIDGRSLFAATSTPLLIALAFYGGTRGIFIGGALLYERLVHKSIVFGEWGWIELYQNSLIIFVLFLTLPLATVSALPVANAWDYTLKRVVQAVLAVYAVVLSAGIASALVGVILAAVEEFVG